MAKRTLGLGKAAKERKKKQKVEIPATESISASSKPLDTEDKNTNDDKITKPKLKSNEITVELDEEVDPDDELAQLKGLWTTYIKSDRENEAVLNGIIHECDRLLRNQSTDEGDKLPSEFHSLYALALAELANFQVDDGEEEDDKETSLKDTKPTVGDFFKAALERIELGQEIYPESIELDFAKARIILSQIPLEYISKFDLNTEKDKKIPNISKLLDEAISSYTKAEKSVELLENYSLLDINVFETLKALEDLLDIVQNFGKDDIAEGLDSDEEESDDDEVKLSPSHPLYKVSQTDKYFQWLLLHGEKFGNYVLKEYEHLLKQESETLSSKQVSRVEFLRNVSSTIGQLLLQGAEKPSSIFTTITYESDVEDDAVIEGLTAKEAQKQAIELTKKAVEFFKIAEDEEEPQTWVDHAEAIISLGNLYDYESKEQEEAYNIAEKKLIRANNATNGKYQSALDNLKNQ